MKNHLGIAIPDAQNFYKSAGPSHHQTSDQKKAFGELYWLAVVNLKYTEVMPISNFPIQISIERKYKSARCVLNQFIR